VNEWVIRKGDPLGIPTEESLDVLYGDSFDESPDILYDE
jgi:hypothetical protein